MKGVKNNSFAKSKMLYTCRCLEKADRHDCDENIASHFEGSWLLRLRASSVETKVCKQFMSAKEGGASRFDNIPCYCFFCFYYKDTTMH